MCITDNGKENSYKWQKKKDDKVKREKGKHQDEYFLLYLCWISQNLFPTVYPWKA